MTIDSMTIEMVVTVDTRGSDGYRNFIFNIFRKITSKYSGHSFIFFAEQGLTPFVNGGNITHVTVREPALPLLGKYKISALLKKYKADVFVTHKTIGTHVPQCLIAFDQPRKASLKKAAVIVCDSQSSAKQIRETFKTDPGKIDIVYKGFDDAYVPVSTDQKEIIIFSVADGNEFFLAEISSGGNLVNVLKAFSVFKKMQKSNMHLLVIAGNPDEFSAVLNSYKYKTAVNVLESTHLQQLPAITASAYAFISVDDYSGILNAMQCGIPVIAHGNDENAEICGEAALYFDKNDHPDIAAKMMLIYKDEKLRSQLIQKAQERINKYTWDNSAGQLWKSIEKACR